jgi:hypothetical protein
MTSVPLHPAVSAPPSSELDGALPGPSADGGLFGGLVGGFESAGAALERAEHADRAFANGRGGLGEMVFERARADSILSIASAGASKAAQALNTILNMQV